MLIASDASITTGGMAAPARYELLGPLATGGMAEVLLAKSRGPNGFERLLAVKRILPERAKDPEMVRMLLDEARNAAQLSHHRIVQVFDIELRDGIVFYAMEYLHGQTLAAVIERAGKLPLETALAVCIAVADGLHHAHERPQSIIHRDVAPSNVMLGYDGNIKLIDFGIASSPEQCRCEPVDRRSDVYSLAIMLYELTTGRPAIVADDELQLVARMGDAQIAPPRTFDPAYPAELEAIVMKALARDREQRYPTAAAFQHELEVFAQQGNLNLSDLAISRMMTKMFANELEPWERARATGLSLEEYVVGETVRAAPPTFQTWSLEGQPTIPQARRERRRARRRRRWAIRAAIVLAIFVVAYVVAARLMAGSG